MNPDEATDLHKQLGLSLALIVITACAYGFLWDPGGVPYSRHSDLVANTLSTKYAAYASLRAGDGLPLWRSDVLSGGPALTHPQALYTHPFQFLFLIWDPLRAAGPTLWIHFVTIALSFQILGRVMGLCLGAQAVMALSGLFAFKLIVIAYAAWFPILPIFSYAPLLFAAIFSLIRRPRLRAMLALAAVGSLCLHSGHLQLVYYCVVPLGALVCLEVGARIRSSDRTNALRIVGFAVAAVALASLSAAYLLIPLAADIPLNSRTAADYDGYFVIRELSARHLQTFLHPEILGTPLDDSYPAIELWEDVAYFGAVPEVLAIIGIVLGLRRRYTGFFALTLFGSVLLSTDSALNRALFEVLPGYALFRGPNRLLFLTTLAGIPLAGIGFDQIVERLRRSGRRPAIAIGVTSVLLIPIVGEGLYFSRRYLEMRARDEVLPATEFQEFFARDTGVYRIAPLGRSTINYGWAGPMELELVTGYDAYIYKHYRDYMSVLRFGRLLPPHAPVWTDIRRVKRWDLLAALNTKYLAAPSAMETLPANLRLVARLESQPTFVFYRGLAKREMFIYENDAFKPRAFFPEKVLSVNSPEEARSELLQRDLNRVAIVEGVGNFDDESGVADRTGPGGGIDRISSRYGSSVYEVERPGDVENRRARFAVLSEIWHPGWRATLDGENAPIYRTNVALMGVVVPPGAHTLELEFQPLHWHFAIALTCASFAVFVGLLVFDVARRLLSGAPGPRPVP